jgi:hypothetical protein
MLVVLRMGVGFTGCTYGVDGDTVDPLDAAFPDAAWETISRSELIGSEDEFKNDRMRLYFEDGDYKECVVERIDSTFVYSWYQMEHLPRRLAKTRLEDVTRVERYVSATEKAKWYHWGMAATIIVISLAVVVVMAVWQGAAGAF